jgi:hypothetical protein
MVTYPVEGGCLCGTVRSGSARARCAVAIAIAASVSSIAARLSLPGPKCRSMLSLTSPARPVCSIRHLGGNASSAPPAGVSSPTAIAGDRLRFPSTRHRSTTHRRFRRRITSSSRGASPGSKRWTTCRATTKPRRPHVEDRIPPALTGARLARAWKAVVTAGQSTTMRLSVAHR